MHDSQEQDIYRDIHLEDCPFCGGPALLEEEREDNLGASTATGWAWYVMCLDCGAQTADIEFHSPDMRTQAARQAAELWNMRKAVRPNASE